ncbi:MAG: hypothetical protein CL840_08020 [Crocinitomicaceae bacterium]|nr:hypothetical protein [Crocinitomicaceae bacterium]|tara:strand:- start:492 stop:2345 length:1854 start_codon:yes stop_codon:yes gene_type:complete
MAQININLFALCLFIGTLGFAQQEQSVETITLNPHPDIRIVYNQLRAQKVKHGKYTYYHRNVRIVEGNFVAGRKHGKWKRYYLDGTVAINAFYLHNKKHGNWEFYFQNKRKMASIYFTRGHKSGVWTSWFIDGNVRAQLSYKNDTLIGPQKIYYFPRDLESGTPIPQLQIKINIKDTLSKKMMLTEKYYLNGKLFEKYSEIDNTPIGMYESFYFTALPWRKMKYEEDGRLFSIYEYNNPVGKDAERGTFNDGNGELITYNSDGTKFSNVGYANGLRDGKAIIYENDTKELITGYFNDNIPTGTWKQYKRKTAKRELMVEMNYTGDDTAQATFYKSDLKARSTGKLIRKKRCDLWRSYYANNSLKEETFYKMDFQHGTSKGYMDPKQIDFSGGYYYGLKVGTWSYYNDFGKVTFKEQFLTQATADEGYLFSDSCHQRAFMENVFYNTSRYVTKDEKRLSYVVADEKHMNFDHFLHDGNYSSWAPSWMKDEEKVKEYKESFKPDFPQFIPWEVDKRSGVVEDNDLGLFLETLNPKKLKIKGDKASPKLGVAMVLLELDEFGFCTRTRIVRGIDPTWDQKILDLFSTYQFWEPALMLNQPIANTLQFKIPIELELVKKME